MIAAANFVGLPLMFISAILIPPRQMPNWIAAALALQPGELGRPRGCATRSSPAATGARAASTSSSCSRRPPSRHCSRRGASARTSALSDDRGRAGSAGDGRSHVRLAVAAVRQAARGAELLRRSARGRDRRLVVPFRHRHLRRPTERPSTRSRTASRGCSQTRVARRGRCGRPHLLLLARRSDRPRSRARHRRESRSRRSSPASGMCTSRRSTTVSTSTRCAPAASRRTSTRRRRPSSSLFAAVGTRKLALDSLHGTVDLLVDAYDTPPPPLPAPPWNLTRVAPALIRWRLVPEGQSTGTLAHGGRLPLVPRAEGAVRLGLRTLDDAQPARSPRAARVLRQRARGTRRRSPTAAIDCRSPSSTHRGTARGRPLGDGRERLS